MTRSNTLKTGALAAAYLLWLGIWIVVGDQPLRDGRHWDQAGAAAIAAVIAFGSAYRSASPYRGFLVAHGVAFLLLAGSWWTYRVPDALPSAVAGGAYPDIDSDWLYAGCAFVLMCAWGHLALLRWHGRPLSALTLAVFAVLMAGLGAVFATFYGQQYRDILNTASGRLDAVTAAIEFAVLAAGLLCMLLREPPAVVWMLVGTVILIAGDMAYSTASVPDAIDAVWMFGQFLLVAAMIGLRDTDAVAIGTRAGPRSNLSGMLILLSLGAVLLGPLVWFLPGHTAWKAFCSVLFVVALVTLVVWVTDRFDDTVRYVRGYVRRMLEARLTADDWHAAQPRVAAALRTTGLDAFLDDFRESAARLRRDVLFLGPERLYGMPQALPEARAATCFIVMPFSQAWSADVHRILAKACDAVGVRAVRGDDLFTPTDILEDIWQSINAADFVIADITGRNPNVLYELGIAHTLAKPVLILSKEAADIPIDLATRRVILYGQNAAAWREELARMIGEAIGSVLSTYSIANAGAARTLTAGTGGE